MKELLLKAGFTLRGPSRATCIHCTGGDRQTVSFNSYAAHCFRCGWKTNRIALSKHLRIILTPQQRLELGREQRQAMRVLALQAAFEQWRSRKVRALIVEFRMLLTTVRHAHFFLDNELAWDVLAKFYNSEISILEQYDFLQCTKASAYRDEDSRLQDVIAVWRSERGAH